MLSRVVECLVHESQGVRVHMYYEHTRTHRISCPDGSPDIASKLDAVKYTRRRMGSQYAHIPPVTKRREVIMHNPNNAPSHN